MATVNKIMKPELAWRKHKFKTGIDLRVRKDQFRRCVETNDHGRACGRIPSDPLHRFYPCRVFGCQLDFTSIEGRLMHEEKAHPLGFAV